MKAHAALGLGVANVAEPTFDPLSDTPLRARDVAKLFPCVEICFVTRTDSDQSELQTSFLGYLGINLSK